MICVDAKPREPKTDLSTEFENQILQAIGEQWEISFKKSVPYFHHSNLVECQHTEINKQLKLLIPDPPAEWTHALISICLARNSQVNKIAGFTPNHLFFGRESIHPLQSHLQTLPDKQHPAEHLLELKKNTDIITQRLYLENILSSRLLCTKNIQTSSQLVPEITPLICMHISAVQLTVNQNTPLAVSDIPVEPEEFVDYWLLHSLGPVFI